MTGDDEIDDLLGSAPGRGRGRPRKDEQPTFARPLQEELSRAANGKSVMGDPYALVKPVSPRWLAAAFRMDDRTVKKRLARCNPIGTVGTRLVYDFVEAAAYLVTPKIDVAAYIASIDMRKLPHHINKTYWEAANSRLRYELRAGDAWATEDVLEVFGEVFLSLKEQTQLWVDNLHEETPLTDIQRATLRRMVDQLLSDMHSKLVEMPSKRRTYSRAAAQEAEEELPQFEEEDGLLEWPGPARGRARG